MDFPLRCVIAEGIGSQEGVELVKDDKTMQNPVEFLVLAKVDYQTWYAKLVLKYSCQKDIQLDKTWLYLIVHLRHCKWLRTI